MLSYTESRNLLANFTNSDTTNSTTMALLDQFLNDSFRTIGSIRGGDWWWLEDTDTQSTVASQQGYQIPNKFRKLIDVYTTVGTTIYTPTPVFSANKWKIILASQLGESDTPLFYYQEGNKILFAPTPSSTAGTITMRGRLNIIDSSKADYTTGTVITTVVGDETVVGSGTTWTAGMVGSYIKIDDANGANEGDNQWYEIASRTSDTELELVKGYEGTAITAGSATYTIAQVSPIPEAYHFAPIYRATAIFTSINDPLHPNTADRWWRLYDGGNEIGLSQTVGGLVGQMLQSEGGTIEGNYISPDSVNIIDINNFPENLTGFN